MIIMLPMQIDLLNGNKELITNEQDLVDIADKYVGYEYSKIIEDIVNTKDEASQYAEMKFNSDMNSYEAQLEEYNSCLLDLDEVVDKLEDYLLDAKRITRNNVEDYVKEIRRIINEYY